MSEIGDECPSCKEAGELFIDDYYVQCNNCDFQRFSTQAELDDHVNRVRHERDPTSPRLLTVIEAQRYIMPRNSQPQAIQDIVSARFAKPSPDTQDE